MGKKARKRSGVQCCVVCGRMLTDRALHDALEQQVLAVIRSEHPEWVEANGACTLCIKKYRAILTQRARRAEEEREKARRPRWPAALIYKFVKSLSITQSTGNATKGKE